jgi:hypothetical protein
VERVIRLANEVVDAEAAPFARRSGPRACLALPPPHFFI